jgi:hypothetical protein
MFTIFISSRNNDTLTIAGANTGVTLTAVRQFIKDEIESIKLFDKDFFNIRINEAFSAAALADSYKTCIKEVQDADFFIALYNGVSGWAPTGIDLGICHAELDESLRISSKKTAYIDISKYFIPAPADAEEIARNKVFRDYVSQMNPFFNPLKPAEETVDGIKQAILKAVKGAIFTNLQDRIRLSNLYYDIEGNNKISLDWKKLKYADREKKIRDRLTELVNKNPDLTTMVTNVSAVPDNLSVNDARSFIGRPFLKDQDLIGATTAGATPLYGPVHFIGVYGKATELQVKNMVGYPDLSVIKDEFGIYLWEQNSQIQLVFLTDCRTPQALTARFLLFMTWIKSSGEYANLLKRAEARHMILTAINNAKKITM